MALAFVGSIGLAYTLVQQGSDTRARLSGIQDFPDWPIRFKLPAEYTWVEYQTRPIDEQGETKSASVNYQGHDSESGCELIIEFIQLPEPLTPEEAVGRYGADRDWDEKIHLGMLPGRVSIRSIDVLFYRSNSMMAIASSNDGLVIIVESKTAESSARRARERRIFEDFCASIEVK